MGRDTEIPGLIAISEMQGDDGRTSFIFEIEDDKVDLFYQAFGLQPGDDESFRRVLVEAIEAMIDKGRREKEHDLPPASQLP